MLFKTSNFKILVLHSNITFGFLKILFISQKVQYNMLSEKFLFLTQNNIIWTLLSIFLFSLDTDICHIVDHLGTNSYMLLAIMIKAIVVEPEIIKLEIRQVLGVHCV